MRAFMVLTKPRIVTLLAFTAYCAMIAANHGLPGLRVTVFGILGLAMCAGGSAVMNMWYDQDIDAVMHRTKRRPLPAGIITSRQAFTFGILLTALGVVVLYVMVNPLSALLGFLGALYYGVVYTMLLKRRTPQNIVIGGGAGAFPPLVGWAAVTGHLAPAAWWMFALIFLWTPGHFWALSLYKAEDYEKAGVPMMPVVRGARSTKRQMLVYSVLLMAGVAFAPAIGLNQPVLVGGCLVLTGWFFVSHIFLLQSPYDSTIWAKRTFLASLLILPAMFTLIAVSLTI
ncbi:protoheme IX farnesyltransferase [Alicyclobacillus ferrooxydans]|uniref:Protoheme IX farnesyltransferase n=2 Tax=Alicyclobacillus ferrooxydans TaxID=471514 RepID=A0A0P9CHZ5_9BACL|nr:protoheme IX farnesyltransferase [Alicyclobacillus ferrooxydans]